MGILITIIISIILLIITELYRVSKLELENFFLKVENEALEKELNKLINTHQTIDKIYAAKDEKILSLKEEIEKLKNKRSD